MKIFCFSFVFTYKPNNKDDADEDDDENDDDDDNLESFKSVFHFENIKDMVLASFYKVLMKNY